MSVKGKVKRLNRKVEELNSQIEELSYEMECNNYQHKCEKEMLENLIKFFVDNQVGKPAEGGVHIEKQYVNKLDHLNVDVWYDIDYNAYVIELKEKEE